MKPLLSILIPAIPSRFSMAEKLYKHLLELVGDKEIEVLMFMDNKKRSIGMKREALKNISKGKYFMFCDDDDWLESIEEVYQSCSKHVDVITFKAKCKNNSGSEFIVTFGLGNEVEHNNDGNGNYLDLKRPPFHQCAWNERFRDIPYPDISYGEDWVWVEQCLKTAKTEIFIDKIIHHYNYDQKVSEASLESNEHWINPNQRRAIVNFATEEYFLGQDRLKESLKNSPIDFIGFHLGNLECSPHSENPYAFKPISMHVANSYGYMQVLWLDASVWLEKSIDPVFDWITRNGFFVEDSGHMVGDWCNDITLKWYSITREQAMQMRMISSGFVGIDFTSEVGKELFEKWEIAMYAGMFKGSWDDHRHDQTCLSIIIHKMKLDHLISPCGHFFSYIGDAYMPPQETAVCHLQGIR